MRTIAKRYLEDARRPAAPLPSFREVKQLFNKAKHVIFFGTISIILYSLLYLYSQNLIDIAQNAHHGHKSLFFIPVLIALIFSLVHGSFTAHFWETLGVRAKKA